VRQEPVSGGWVKLTPRRRSRPRVRIVEMLNPKEMNLYVWDFGMDPNAPRTAPPGALSRSSAPGYRDNESPVLDKRK